MQSRGLRGTDLTAASKCVASAFAGLSTFLTTLGEASMRSIKELRRRRSPMRAVEVLERRHLLAGDVLANHGTPGSTGAYLSETVLTPVRVASTQAANSITTNFGRQFSTSLDGQLYAQPLAVANVNITRGPSPGIHNVLVRGHDARQFVCHRRQHRRDPLAGQFSANCRSARDHHWIAGRNDRRHHHSCAHGQ